MRALLLSLLIVAPAFAGVSDDARLLPIRREIRLPETTAEHVWIEIREDDTLLADAAPKLEDVRIVTESGDVIPYLFLDVERTTDQHWMHIDDIPLDWTPDPTRGHVCRLDLAAEAGAHLLVLPGERDRYDTHVRLRRSGTSWQTASPRFTTISFTPLESDARLTLHVTARSIELRTAPGMEPVEGSATLYRSVERCQPSVSIPAPEPKARFDGRTWHAEYELGGSPRSITGMRFEPSPSLRFRNGGVSLRTDKGWKRTFFHDSHLPECLVAGDTERGWRPLVADGVRLTIEAADPPNEPIRVTEFVAIPARLQAWVPTGERLWLAYGDPTLRRPNWRTPARVAVLETPVVTLGKAEPNPLHDPPGFGLTWLQRHPAVVGGLMLALLAGIGITLLTWRPKD